MLNKSFGDLTAGVAEIDITPPVGVALAGGLLARKSKVVNDPLYARALVLSDGKKYAAIVALDLIVICRENVEAACELICQQKGIPKESVLVCASHTHSGPYPAGLLDPEAKPDPSYMNEISRKMAKVVSTAYERLQPAKIGFSSTKVRGIAGNRRFIDRKGSAWNRWLLNFLPEEEKKSLKAVGPVDEELLVLAVKDKGDNPLAIVFNYPLHANMFGGQRNNKISADYPGYVALLIKQRLGGDVITLFTPGACGDINSKGKKVNDVGEEIASEILSVIEQMEYVSRVRLSGVLREICIPLRDFSRFQEEEVLLKWPHSLDVFRNEHRILNELPEKEVSTVLHALRINDAVFVGIPGELFCQLGLDIKAGSPFRYNFVSELSDDYIGYIPTSKAFEQGGYETFNARSSKVAAGSGERLVQESLDMLQTLVGL